MHINLNDYVTVNLTERGREIWREHVRARNADLASSGVDTRLPFTGEETKLKVQFWEFIGAFGKDGKWFCGGDPVCGMDVVVDSPADADLKTARDHVYVIYDHYAREGRVANANRGSQLWNWREAMHLLDSVIGGEPKLPKEAP